jgi:hypothetical protein
VEEPAIVADKGINTVGTELAVNNAEADNNDQFMMSGAFWGVIAVVIALVFLVAVLAVRYRSSSAEVEAATNVLRKINSVGMMSMNNSGMMGYPMNGSFHNGSMHSMNGMRMDSSMIDYANTMNAFAGSQSMGMPTPHRNAWSPDQQRAASMGAPTPPVYRQSMRRGPGMPAPKIDSALLINGADRRPSMVTGSMLNNQTDLNRSGLGYQYAKETGDVGSTNTDEFTGSNIRKTMFVEHPPLPVPLNMPESQSFSFAV